MENSGMYQTRRSIRRFTEQPIPDEVLNELLDAVRWASSGQILNAGSSGS